MRRNSHHCVRSSDAVAHTLEGAWAYSPSLHEWQYILWTEPKAFHCMNQFGQEYTSHLPIEIEAISPAVVEGTTPANYIERLAYARAEAGWTF